MFPSEGMGQLLITISLDYVSIFADKAEYFPSCYILVHSVVGSKVEYGYQIFSSIHPATCNSTCSSLYSYLHN